jgi:hypothetical protein
VLLAMVLFRGIALAAGSGSINAPTVSAPVNAANPNLTFCGVNANAVGSAGQTITCAPVGQGGTAATATTTQPAPVVAAPFNAANPNIAAGGINANLGGQSTQATTSAPMTQGSGSSAGQAAAGGSAVSAAVNAGNPNVAAIGVNANAGGQSTQTTTGASTTQTSGSNNGQTTAHTSVASAPVDAGNPNLAAGGANVNAAGQSKQTTTAAPTTQGSGSTTAPTTTGGALVTAPVNAGNPSANACGVNAIALGRTQQINTCAPATQSSGSGAGQATTQQSTVSAPTNAANANANVGGVNANAAGQSTQTTTAAPTTQTSGTTAAQTGQGGALVSAPINAANPNVAACGVNANVAGDVSQSSSCAPATQGSGSTAGGSTSQTDQDGSLVTAPANAGNANVTVCGVNANVGDGGTQSATCAPSRQGSGSSTGSSSGQDSLIAAPANAANPSVTVCGVNASVARDGAQSSSCAPTQQSSGSTSGGAGQNGALTSTPRQRRQSQRDGVRRQCQRRGQWRSDKRLRPHQSGKQQHGRRNHRPVGSGRLARHRSCQRRQRQRRRVQCQRECARPQRPIEHLRSNPAGQRQQCRCSLGGQRSAGHGPRERSQPVGRRLRSQRRRGGACGTV